MVETTKKTYGLAIATLITGIFSGIGIQSNLGLIQFFLIILTIIFGVVSLIEIKKHPHLTGKGYVIAGFIFMVVFFIISAMVLGHDVKCNKAITPINLETKVQCDAQCILSCIDLSDVDKAEWNENLKTCRCICNGCV